MLERADVVVTAIVQSATSKTDLEKERRCLQDSIEHKSSPSQGKDNTRPVKIRDSAWMKAHQGPCKPQVVRRNLSRPGDMANQRVGKVKTPASDGERPFHLCQASTYSASGWCDGPGGGVILPPEIKGSPQQYHALVTTRFEARTRHGKGLR